MARDERPQLLDLGDELGIGLGSLGQLVQQYEIAGDLRRLLAVLRMRFSVFDRTIRELVLDTQGVRILPPEQSKLGLLATGAQLSGGVAPRPSPPGASPAGEDGAD